MPIRPSICAIQAIVQKRLPHRVDITNVSTIEVYTKIQTYLAQNVTLDPTKPFSVETEWCHIAAALEIDLSIIANLPPRLFGSLAVTRCIGDAYLKNVQVSETVQLNELVIFQDSQDGYTGLVSTPEITGYWIKSNDVGIILTSDGIVNSLTAEKIAECFELTGTELPPTIS
jgi:hypothetical protein